MQPIKNSLPKLETSTRFWDTCSVSEKWHECGAGPRSTRRNRLLPGNVRVNKRSQCFLHFLPAGLCLNGESIREGILLSRRSLSTSLLCNPRRRMRLLPTGSLIAVSFIRTERREKRCGREEKRKKERRKKEIIENALAKTCLYHGI